jgi:dihydroxyacetone kinase DhaKLM complex PTS-EIIA-like component DhaM
MKNKLLLSIPLLLFVTFCFAQVRIVNNTRNNAAANSSAFIDASSNLGNNNNATRGKGILFPRTNLQIFNNFGGAPIGVPTSYPTRYDGLIVYNTATSGEAGVGNTEGTLSEGYWFYENKTNSTNGGTWKPLGSAEAPKVHVTENEVTETNLVMANTATEKVISITGTADGITTHMDLGTSVLSEDTVVNFRKAIICDSNGTQVLVATGSYDSATNKFVTGNGMMNICLPAANDYKVELYFTSN